MRNKRGVELSMNVIIIAILVILVLIVVSIFFLGGFNKISETIRNIFNPQIKGTDVSIAIETCKTKCILAQQTNAKDVYCKTIFKIDSDGNGYADYEDEDAKRYKEFHCYDTPINTPCPGIDC